MAGLMASGMFVWVAAGAGAGLVAGASIALAVIRRDHGEARVHRILTAIDGEPTREECAALADAPGIWGQLYQRLDDLVQEKKNSSVAFLELERVRRHVELATSLLREGKDPLTELAELRVGPLHDLLEASRGSISPPSVVSRMTLGEEELVGASADALPETWPAPERSVDPAASGQLLEGVEELIAGLEGLESAMARTSSREAAAGAPSGGGPRTPAQLVDAVVHTAADGIEDLAAGLMRANELASVAERVTNRATLLALNAALEATRSGSEAFAAIAEETRRLAEFAREATDTISRLAGEIEYKVGETITAIHRTSEDAKSALSALSGTASAMPAAPPGLHGDAVRSLLSRARALRIEVSALTTAAPVPDHADAFEHAPLPVPDEPVAAPGVTLEIAPRFEEAPSSEDDPQGFASEAPSAAAGETQPTEYLHLLDRLNPGGGAS